MYNTDILCKARRLDNGEWVTGYYVHLVSGLAETSRIYTGLSEIDTAVYEWYPKFYEVDPKTVCQFTRMKDSKGNLIFENDIIKFEIHKKGFWVESKVVYNRHLGEFRCVSFTADYSDGDISLYRVVECCPWNSTEVIGNHYDDYSIDAPKYRRYK